VILCVRIPAFGAAVEARANTALEDQPFVLIDPASPARIVQGASNPALGMGIRIGMTLRQAQSIWSDLQVVTANPARTRRATDQMMETLATFTDLVEIEALPYQSTRSRRPQLAIGTDEGDGVWFINPGRLLREQGFQLAQTIQENVWDSLRLAPAVGLAANRFTARVAAGSLDSRQVLLVPRDGEREFLAPYPAALLPVYPEQARQLHLLGIHTLGDLAKLPAAALGDLFGRQGAAFKRLAEGRDTTPVRLYVPRRSECAAHQLDQPVDDSIILTNVIGELTADLAQRLERRGQLASELMLILIQAGGGSQLAEVVLRQPSASAEHLARTLSKMLGSLQITESIAEVEVTLGGIVEAEARQLSMFPTENIPQNQLREILHQLIARHGAETFFWADITAPEALIPERRFRMRQVEAA
jgi:nucleotidyltransferase/DNA polymerase involved in DNA repair